MENNEITFSGFESLSQIRPNQLDSRRWVRSWAYAYPTGYKPVQRCTKRVNCLKALLNRAPQDSVHWINLLNERKG